MKGKFSSFLAGVLVTALAVTLPVSALAATGRLTIEVSPINIQVNGEMFRPKDAAGNDALVFTYNGTTYAPLRALAEAYGLEVGYDAASNLATVKAPATAASAIDAGEFASQWTVKEKPVTHYGDEKVFTAVYSGPLDMVAFRDWWKSMDAADIKAGAEQMALDAQSLVPGYHVTLYFSYGAYNLGTAFALDGYGVSNFDAAGVWIASE